MKHRLQGDKKTLASDSLELGLVRLLMRANLIALFFLAFFYNAED